MTKYRYLFDIFMMLCPEETRRGVEGIHLQWEGWLQSLWSLEMRAAIVHSYEGALFFISDLDSVSKNTQECHGRSRSRPFVCQAVIYLHYSCYNNNLEKVQRRKIMSPLNLQRLCCKCSSISLIYSKILVKDLATKRKIKQMFWNNYKRQTKCA